MSDKKLNIILLGVLILLLSAVFTLQFTEIQKFIRGMGKHEYQARVHLEMELDPGTTAKDRLTPTETLAIQKHLDKYSTMLKGAKLTMRVADGAGPMQQLTLTMHNDDHVATKPQFSVRRQDTVRSINKTVDKAMKEYTNLRNNPRYFLRDTKLNVEI